MTKTMEELTNELSALRDSHSSMYQILAEKDNQLDAVMQENRKHTVALEEKHRQAKMQVPQDTTVVCLENAS